MADGVDDCVNDCQGMGIGPYVGPSSGGLPFSARPKRKAA